MREDAPKVGIPPSPPFGFQPRSQAATKAPPFERRMGIRNLPSKARGVTSHPYFSNVHRVVRSTRRKPCSGSWRSSGGMAVIGNKPVENAIPSSEAGKKSSQFVGDKNTARRSGFLRTPSGFTPRHGYEPHAYLRNVLERTPSTTTAGHDAPLPDNCCPARQLTEPIQDAG